MHSRKTARSMRTAMLGLALLAVAACEKRPDDAAGTGRAAQVTSSDTGVPMVPPAAALAAKRATNADVKAYARLMMGEHHALRRQGQQLAKSLSITPEPPANDPVKSAAQSEMRTLEGTPKGAQ